MGHTVHVQNVLSGYTCTCTHESCTCICNLSL